MSARAIARLVHKDCWLMRLPLALYTAVAALAAGLTAAGGTALPPAGLTLALNVIIGVSFHVVLGVVIGERQGKTMALVMSLPVSPREVAAAKLVSSLVLFLVPSTVTCAAFLPGLGGAPYYGLILGAWVLFFSVVLGAALVSESLGFTVGTLIALLFVVGNGVMQIAPRLAWARRYLADLARGGPALPLTAAAEVAGIALVVAVTLWLCGRKSSFV